MYLHKTCLHNDCICYLGGQLGETRPTGRHILLELMPIYVAVVESTKVVMMINSCML